MKINEKLIPKLKEIDEIKTQLGYKLVTNGNPVKTGRKIDGKDEYIKRVSISQFPNNSGLDVETGLNHSNINFTDEITGLAISSQQILNVPFVSLGGLGIQVAVQLWKNTITVTTSNDRSSYSGFLDIRFTYKSDNA